MVLGLQIVWKLFGYFQFFTFYDLLMFVGQDGTWSTVTGACTWVRDFFDFVYHSILDSLNEFRLGEPKNGKPTEIK